jgi:hypothetical protein
MKSVRVLKIGMMGKHSQNEKSSDLLYEIKKAFFLAIGE